MKLQEFLAINGARVTAEKLVNMRIQYATGLSMSDLPDRNEFWDIVEDIEEELNEEDFDMQKIKESLREITPELIQQLCW
jgi:formylmethanofuran dehydrogenase subunit E